jgi:hypothetical protein
MFEFVTEAVTWLAKMLGIYTPPEPKPRDPEEVAVIGDTQKARAEAKYKSLDAASKKKFDEIKGQAKNKKESGYLDKALATNHSMAEIEAFAAKIRGKDEKWLQDNLSLTGNTEGKGVKQQWKHSCNATTVQAVRGQLDPIYALKLHEENADVTSADNKDGAKLNPKLAADQKAALESEYKGKDHGKHKGTAVSRDDKGGGGRWADDLLNDMSDATGLEYGTKTVDDKTYTVSDAMKDVESAARGGTPVPIVIGNGLNQFTHYVLVTGLAKGSPKSWVIHDPWDGITVTRTASDVKSGKINLAGSNRITAVENPSAKK